MKIYCILFDTCPQNKQIEDLFNSKNLHYSNYITNSWTGTTLMSMFSGKTEELIRRIRRAQYASLNVIIFKPKLDTRDKKNTVVSHDGTVIKSFQF